MEKPYYKIIILVLASDNIPLYSQFKYIWEQYHNLNKEIKVFYTYGAGIKFNPSSWDLVFDIPENITPPNSAKKVIKALEYIDKNYKYDYLIRTNLSTFWDFNGILSRVNTLPRTDCLSGNVGLLSPPFVTGISMILSANLIPKIIADQDKVLIKYPKYVAEDRMISEYFYKYLGIPIINTEKRTHRIEDLVSADETKILEEINLGKKNGCDHFRVKNLHNRELIDTQVHKTLLKMYYGKEL